MDAIVTMPTWLIITVCVLVFVIPASIVCWLVVSNRYATVEEDNTVVGPAVGFLGTAFTLLLAFVIVNVWTGVSDREAALYDEFANVNTIVLEVQAIDPGAKAEFVATLDAYLKAVIATEIEEDAPVGGSPAAVAAFNDFLTLVDKEEAALTADATKAGETGGIFTEAQSLAEAREKRVATTGPEIGGVFAWIIVILGWLTVLSVAILPSSSTRKAKWLTVLSVAVSVGLLTSLLFYLSSTDYISSTESGQVERIVQQLEQHAAE